MSRTTVYRLLGLGGGKIDAAAPIVPAWRLVRITTVRSRTPGLAHLVGLLSD